MACIWYKSESGEGQDIIGRANAVQYLSKKIIEEADKAPEWIDELMRSYGFIVVDDDDTLPCLIDGWDVPIALLPHQESKGREDDRCLRCETYDVCHHERWLRNG